MPYMSLRIHVKSLFGTCVIDVCVCLSHSWRMHQDFVWLSISVDSLAVKDDDVKSLDDYKTKQRMSRSYARWTLHASTFLNVYNLITSITYIITHKEHNITTHLRRPCLLTWVHVYIVCLCDADYLFCTIQPVNMPVLYQHCSFHCNIKHLYYTNSTSWFN